MKSNYEFDFLIIGGGIIGLALAFNLATYFPDKRICIIEKESDLGVHASGRNSGVIHSGIYYKKGSLKSIFSKEGNKFLRQFCIDNGIGIKSEGKLIVAKNETELEGLFFLSSNAKDNDIEVFLLKEKDLKDFEINAKTFKYFLYVPSTFVVNPKEIIDFLFKKLKDFGVFFLLGNKFKNFVRDGIVLVEDKFRNKKLINYNFLINSAGLYADSIAHDFEVALNYTIVPFKGLYLIYDLDDKFISKNIYPVPDLKFPFLGVHFTVGDYIKIGPTATLAFYKENYKFFYRFSLNEFWNIAYVFFNLFVKGSKYRNLFVSEFKKNIKYFLYKEASKLVKHIPSIDKFKWYLSGVRAQLVDMDKMELVDDFIIKESKNSIHILNVVSPGFTASFPFSKYIIQNFILNKFKKEIV